MFEHRVYGIRQWTDSQSRKRLPAIIDKKAGPTWPESSGTVSPCTAFVTRLFAEFDARNICYCVLRSFEGLPAKVDGDIDILVRSADLQKAETTLTALMEGFLLISRVERNGHLQFCVASEDEMGRAVRENRGAQVVQLDFVTELQWKGMAYLDTEAVLSARQWYGNFYVAARAHRVAHLLCHAILDKNFVKSAHKKVIEESISQDGDVALASLKPFIGHAMVRRLYSAFRTGDDAEILGVRKPLIIRLLFYRHRSVLSCIVFLMRKYMRIGRAVLFPPGVLIATAGPDGAGKTTLLSRIGMVLSGAFEPIKDQYMGWKQFILPTKRLLRLVQNVLARRRFEKTPTEDPLVEMCVSWTHNLSVLHYFLDLWTRYLFQIWPVLARGGLVLCDRYFYDILAQGVLLCRNPWLPSLLLALTPRPTVTILFTGDPEAIAARKQENSAAETAWQLARLSVLKGTSGDILELEATNVLDRNVMVVLNFLFEQSDEGATR